ncbi:MAG: hypothetical protein J6S75_10075, partial [Thermoguttaceae bacterium]|nr:hypothetical protein [Thermoguttaceae bacterium]
MTGHQRGIGKKILFAGIAGIAAAAVLTVGMTAATAQVPDAMYGTNLSFEEISDGGRPVHWSADAKFFRVERDAGRGVTAALRLDADGQTHTTASQVIEVVPGTKLQYSAYIRTEGIENGTAKVAIEWTGREKWIGGSYSHPLSEDREDGWQKVGGVAHIPVEADQVKFICYITRGGKGTAWYDDCRVQEVVTSAYSAIT